MSGVKQQHGNKLTAREKIAFFSEHFTTVTHCLIIGFVLYIWYICVKEAGWDMSSFYLHVVLYVTGWVFLMLEGIMSISPNNVISKHIPHNCRSLVHTSFQMLSVGSCLAGFTILYCSRRVHFVSLHSKLGFASLILILPTVLNGFSALFSVKLKRFISPGLHKFIHAFFGISTFVIGTASLYYALEKSWYRNNVGDDGVMLSKVVVLFSVIWSLLSPLATCYERIKYMF